MPERGSMVSVWIGIINKYGGCLYGPGAGPSEGNQDVVEEEAEELPES